MQSLNLTINGESQVVNVDPTTPLLYVLRNQFFLTGAKLGCGLEQCGACAVLIDGISTLICVEPVASFEGCEIITPEGLANHPVGAKVHDTFGYTGAAQCGYCIPGITVAVTGLLNQHPAPTESQTRLALRPHLCRCGTHSRVLQAVDRLAAFTDGDIRIPLKLD